MPRTDRENLRRERILFQYSLALEVGDFEKIANILAVAENDPFLERMILEINDELQGELSYSSMNNNHKGQTTMTLISDRIPRTVPQKRQTRWSGAVALVAALTVVFFVGFLVFFSDGDDPPYTSAIQQTETVTPSLPYNGLTATALWDEKADTDTGVWIEALNPDINVRSGPDIMSDRIGRIQPGEYYVVVGRRFEWLQIQFPERSLDTGWVYEDVVRVIGDEGRIPNVVAEDSPTATPFSTTDRLSENQRTATAEYENQQTATRQSSEQTATAFWIDETQTLAARLTTPTVTPLSTTDGFNENEQTATAYWVHATQTHEALNPNQRTATAFWIDETQTLAARLTTPTITPLSTTEGFNENEQTATAFWILATQTAVATQFPPTVPPPSSLTPTPEMTTTPIPVERIAPSEGALQYPDFDSIFRGIDGTFVLYDPQNDVTVAYNPERAQQRFAPHSTFKILNAAISLETGAMPDEEFNIEWDQEQYPLTEFPQTSPFNEWRQDQNLRTGMQYSVVWFYTEVARLIGEEQMAEWVEAVGYGNMDTSAWLDPVPFWLGGSLEITPFEQTQFLWRFYNGELGFSEDTTDIVKDLIVLEETDTYRLSGKTGTGTDGMAWLVGYLERGDEVYVFALNINLEGTDRLDLTRQVFIEMGLIE